VIVTGGDIDPADPAASQSVGESVAGVLVKPFTLRTMLDEVRRVISVSKRVESRATPPNSDENLYFALRLDLANQLIELGLSLAVQRNSFTLLRTSASGAVRGPRRS
jgi:hypothetical protein